MTVLDAIAESDLADLAVGCAVLGTGGGGATNGSLAAAIAAVRDTGPVPLLAVDDLADDDVVLSMSMIGAPTVGQEMLPSADQSERLVKVVTELSGITPRAIMAAEIGGSNGVSPVAWSARSGLPLLDADSMGRAFPEGQMTTVNIAGIPPGVIVMSDVLGNVSVLHAIDARWAERHARALCVASGASSMVADHTLTGADARHGVLAGSVSRAISIGRAVRGAADPLGALRVELGAAELVEGKVIDVDRTTKGGFVRGAVTISGTGPDKGRLLRIEIQNENLVAIEDGAVLAAVPDLITVVDTQTAAAIFTENLSYGQRVTVLAWPCDPVWLTPKGLELAGPRAFGYDLDHVPVADRFDLVGTAKGPRVTGTATATGEQA